jgi:hypothetical protein
LRPGPGAPTRPMIPILFKPNGRAYFLTPAATNPRFQDPGFIVHITSRNYYEKSGGNLLDPVPIPGGTNTMINVVGKSGQVSIREANQ